jgi:hypothetical protein
MAVFRVWSGGNNVGGANNTDWTQAYTTLAEVLAIPPAAGDVVKVHKTHQDSLSASTTYTIPSGVAIICVNKDASEAPANMGADYWIGSDSLTAGINIACSGAAYLYGLTLRAAGSAVTLTLASTDGSQLCYEECLLWMDSNSTAATTRGIRIGSVNDSQVYVKLKNCTIRFHPGIKNSIRVDNHLVIEGGSVSADGGIPPVLFGIGNANRQGGARLNCIGFDMSAIGSTSILSGSTALKGTAHFHNCILGSGYVLWDTQAHDNLSGIEATLTDCAVGDLHGIFEYHSALGAMVADFGLYRTASPAGCSWKVTTTANCSPVAPFETPWISKFIDTTAAITPWLEVLRKDSTTPYTDAQLWAEFAVKSNSGTVLPVFRSDKQSMSNFGSAGASQPAGVGFAAWTAADSGDWSGKIDSGSSVTPAEPGDMLARAVFTVPSETVYIDPWPQT